MYKEGRDSFKCPICGVEIPFKGKLTKIHNDCIKYIKEHSIVLHTKIDVSKLK